MFAVVFMDFGSSFANECIETVGHLSIIASNLFLKALVETLIHVEAFFHHRSELAIFRHFDLEFILEFFFWKSLTSVPFWRPPLRLIFLRHRILIHFKHLY